MTCLGRQFVSLMYIDRMLSFVIVDLGAMSECTFVHVDGYLRGQGGVCYYRDTIHRGSPETSGEHCYYCSDPG